MREQVLIYLLRIIQLPMLLFEPSVETGRTAKVGDTAGGLLSRMVSGA